MKKALLLILVMSMLCGCAVQEPTEISTEQTKTAEKQIEQSREIESIAVSEQTTEKSTENVIEKEIATQLYAGIRPMLVKSVQQSEIGEITPCVTPYVVEEDLSNVENLWQFYMEDGMRKKLSQNGLKIMKMIMCIIGLLN